MANTSTCNYTMEQFMNVSQLKRSVLTLKRKFTNANWFTNLNVNKKSARSRLGACGCNECENKWYVANTQSQSYDDLSSLLSIIYEDLC